MMLAGAGLGAALEGSGPGVAVALVLVFLINAVKQGLLGTDGAVGADDVGMAAGSGGIFDHLHQCVVALRSGQAAIGKLDQFGFIIIGDFKPVVDHQNVGAGGGEEMSFLVDDQLTLGNGAVFLEVVLVVVQLQPAGVTGAVTAQIILTAVQLQPTGLHDAGFVQIVDLTLNGLPTDLGNAFVAQVVFALFLLQPAGVHHTVILQVVAITVQFQPAVLTDAVFVQIVLAFGQFQPTGVRIALLVQVHHTLFQLQPAGDHGTVFTQIVALAVNGLPVGAANAVLAQIVATVRQIDPADLHGERVGIEIIDITVQLLPAGDGVAIFVQIALTAVIQHIPATLVDGEPIDDRIPKDADQRAAHGQQDQGDQQDDFLFHKKVLAFQSNYSHCTTNTKEGQVFCRKRLLRNVKNAPPDGSARMENQSSAT